jgi:hypothetical protein
MFLPTGRFGENVNKLQHEVIVLFRLQFENAELERGMDLGSIQHFFNVQELVFKVDGGYLGFAIAFEVGQVSNNLRTSADAGYNREIFAIVACLFGNGYAAAMGVVNDVLGVGSKV